MPYSVGAIWQLSRPRTCLVSPLAYAFGVEVVGGPWTGIAWVGVFAALLIPAAANLHNALTDIEEDAENLPGRLALVDALGARRINRIVSIELAAIVLICALTSVLHLVIGAIGAMLLLGYSAGPCRAKARPVLGLVIFSMVVSVPFLLGATIGSSWLEPQDPRTPTVTVWFVFLTLWFIVKGLVKNVPDYHGDLRAGVKTSATIMPSVRSAAVVAVIGTVCGYLLLIPAVVMTRGPAQMFFAAAWIPIAAANVIRMPGASDPGVLNRILKVDMLISVSFLASLAVLSRFGIDAVAVVIVSLAFLAACDIVGADSRSSRHLPADARTRADAPSVPPRPEAGSSADRDRGTDTTASKELR